MHWNASCEVTCAHHHLILPPTQPPLLPDLGLKPIPYFSITDTWPEVFKMRTAVLVLLIALISWLAAYIVDHYYTTGAVERASRSPNSSLTPKDTVKNLFWFLHVSCIRLSVEMHSLCFFCFVSLFWISQLSDIHVSIYHDPDRAKDLKQFAGQVIDTINPSLVVVTGDLTDSKHQNQFLSHQYEQEWMMYSLAITNVQVPWLDMRGNHGELWCWLNKPDFTLHNHNNHTALHCACKAVWLLPTMVVGLYVEMTQKYNAASMYYV